MPDTLFVCTQCGHLEQAHSKSGILADDTCVVGGVLDASHTYAGDTITFTSAFTDRSRYYLPVPLGYYKFPGDAQDEMILSNDGVWSGTEAYTTGFDGTVNHAADFDGASQIDLSNEQNFDFDFTSRFSVSFWWKTPTAGGNQVLLSKRNSFTNSIGWSVLLRSDDKIVWEFDNGAGQEIQVVADNAITDPVNTWHHTVVSYDGSGASTGMLIARDGVVQDIIATPAHATFIGSMLNNLDVTVGAYNGGLLPLTGQIDELAIFDFEMRNPRAAYLYNNGAGRIMA